MNCEKEKISSKRTRRTHLAKQVQYVPPNAVEIEEFTKKVCDVLVKQGRSEFGSNNVRWNVTNLLKLTAELTAKHMNRGHINAKE